MAEICIGTWYIGSNCSSLFLDSNEMNCKCLRQQHALKMAFSHSMMPTLDAKKPINKTKCALQPGLACKISNRTINGIKQITRSTAL